MEFQVYGECLFHYFKKCCFIVFSLVIFPARYLLSSLYLFFFVFFSLSVLRYSQNYQFCIICLWYNFLPIFSLLVICWLLKISKYIICFMSKVHVFFSLTPPTPNFSLMDSNYIIFKSFKFVLQLTNAWLFSFSIFYSCVSFWTTMSSSSFFFSPEMSDLLSIPFRTF